MGQGYGKRWPWGEGRLGRRLERRTIGLVMPNDAASPAGRGECGSLKDLDAVLFPISGEGGTVAHPVVGTLAEEAFVDSIASECSIAEFLAFFSFGSFCFCFVEVHVYDIVRIGRMVVVVVVSVVVGLACESRQAAGSKTEKGSLSTSQRIKESDTARSQSSTEVYPDDSERARQGSKVVPKTGIVNVAPSPNVNGHARLVGHILVRATNVFPIDLLRRRLVHHDAARHAFQWFAHGCIPRRQVG